MYPELDQQISQCQTLPTLPAIAVQVLEAVRNPNCQIPQLARLISKDPALASKILRTANSSIYARPKKVSRLTQAIALLGLHTVRVLVLGFSLAHNLKNYKNRGFRPLEYWRRAIYSATAALTLAQCLHMELLEEAFIAALLMDMGMLALHEMMPEQYDTIHDRAHSHSDLIRLEDALLKTNHAEVSGCLAERWGLPETLAVPIAHHHDAATVSDPTLRQLAEVCYLAGRCADVFVGQSAAVAITELRDYFRSKLNFDDAKCDGLLTQISRRSSEIAPLFDIHLNTDLAYEEILQRANQSIIQLTLEAQERARNPGAYLPAPGEPQPVVSTREQFEEAVAAQLGGSEPFAVALIAIDRLDDLRKERGDEVATAIVNAVSEQLADGIESRNFAARYADDSFAVLMYGAPRGQALARAEAFRSRIGSNPIDYGRLTLPISVTIGVAAAEAGSPFKEPAQLIKAAELALDAARQAGQNCVRAFAMQNPSTHRPAAA